MRQVGIEPATPYAMAFCVCGLSAFDCHSSHGAGTVIASRVVLTDWLVAVWLELTSPL